ncbi:putative bifunctional diguanylate cyclase/phosphodiesterase [Rhodoferax aquaticus]|uniref:EAL domain-containing protein n=1 Tax=Rhodoferax aquaticus TaxID=2527691 RepID=A0A515ENQ3_9BURK|nr:EAL domain-containing protein [Rhodoferax aquaticus]QDL54265.1 EAL domain-containing protein [Rhodoferax aquaticus]
MPSPAPDMQPKTPLAEMHGRRIRLMLWISSALLVLLGGLWGVYFSLKHDWIIVGLDIFMVGLGLASAALTHYKHTRAAFFLMFASLLVLLIGLALVFDVPSPDAPRSVHNFLLVLAVASLMVLRDEPAVLRFSTTGACLAVFVMLASTQFGVAPSYVLPDSVRVGGTWFNNIGAAVGVYALIHVMMADVEEISSLEADLRKSLDRDDFYLVYQPQVTSSGQVIGAEALIRWLHPKLGVVPPGEFIPLAERTGVIVPLGMWVLERACEQLAIWAQNPHTAKLTLSVNVSALQFRQAGFLTDTKILVSETGVDPSRLKLELTESALVKDMDDIVHKMDALKSVGIGFSLDDFGTGYSSLNYLKRLPLDQLKIDQSFVRDVLTVPSDASIARMVISLGKSMGFTVIAEGVETQGQREFLMQNGCHIFQGYLFSKPLQITQFDAYVAERTVA